MTRREDIAYLHFLAVEIFNEERFNQEVTVLLTKLVLDEGNNLIQVYLVVLLVLNRITGR
jgi:hypothetical protein